ncbi:MAG: HAD family hydrolase [Deltaproteobacteria bacterium]|nr:HAD family hydrolase [Deltaproteobacteria bacterium]
MKPVKAIGFDLFNTLISADPGGVELAMARIIANLRQAGFPLEEETFKTAYRQAAIHFIKEARREGRETHNRFWISAALTELGYDLPPEDPRIAAAVEAYFSAFYDFCHLIPGTVEMLRELGERYPLGLLSNFTHAPAARGLMEHLGLTPYFDVVLISGDLGYRKPHPYVFRRLIEALDVPQAQILFIGDDLEPDIRGALEAGLRAVWMTYVRESQAPPFPSSVTPGEEIPEDGVDRIVTWDDLFGLLASE